MTKNGKKILGVPISIEVHNQLRLIAQEEHRSMAQLVQKVVYEYFQFN